MSRWSIPVAATVTDKGMPQDMPTFQVLPLRSTNALLEQTLCLIPSNLLIDR